MKTYGTTNGRSEAQFVSKCIKEIIELIAKTLCENSENDRHPLREACTLLLQYWELTNYIVHELDSKTREYGPVIEFFCELRPKHLFFSAVRLEAHNLAETVLANVTDEMAVSMIAARGTAPFIQARSSSLHQRFIGRDFLLKELAKTLSIQIYKERKDLLDGQAETLSNNEHPSLHRHLFIQCLRITYSVADPSLTRSLVKIYKRLIRSGGLLYVIMYGKSEITALAIRKIKEKDGENFNQMIRRMPELERRYVEEYLFNNM